MQLRLDDRMVCQVTSGNADILNALRGTQGASRALYGAVFGREAVRKQLDQAQRGRGRVGPAEKQAWDVPRRIPAARQPLVRALGQLLGKFPKACTLCKCRPNVLPEIQTLLGCCTVLKGPYAEPQNLSP